MLYTKEGYPEEGEIVKCTVTSVQYHSVFVKLDEYNKSGMIHISEISPGRIRNIRDYVTENKVIICKVLKVKHDKGHIDLSLRRVNEIQRRNKINQLKDEQKAEKIIEFVANELKMRKDDIFMKIKDKILKDHETIYEAFELVLEDNNYLLNLGIEKKYADALRKLILERIKPPIVEMKREFSIHSYEENGLDIIKDNLQNIESEEVKLAYLGGGKYSVEIKDENYKDGEKRLSKILGNIEESFKKSKTIVEIHEK